MWSLTHIQFAAVDMEDPRCLNLSGSISLGYTHLVQLALDCSDFFNLFYCAYTVAWNPIVKAPWKMNNMAAAAAPQDFAIEVLF